MRGRVPRDRPNPISLMKRSGVRIALVASVVLGATACAQDTLLGFAIGDISGLWQASTYVYEETGAGSGSVDLISRDGALFTMTVVNASPPVASTTFDDGAGNVVSGGGPVDIVVGTLEIEGDLYVIDHQDDQMTLTNQSMTFDFGSGARAARLTIELARR